MTLNENMRIQNSGNSPKLVEFDNWLEKLGDGKLDTYGETDYVLLPDYLSVEIKDGKESSCQYGATKFTFGDIETQSALSEWPAIFFQPAISAPTNDVVNQINFKCLHQLPGESIVLPSVSRTIHTDDVPQYLTEYINSLESSDMPPPHRVLKKEVVVVLLRNLNIESGLCNGTRLII